MSRRNFLKRKGPRVFIAGIIMFGLYVYANRDETGVMETKTNLETLESPTTDSENFVKLTMKERKLFVEKRCKDVKTWRKHRDPTEANATVLIDNTYKLIACSNLKVGSSTITNILYTLANLTKTRQKTFRTKVLRQELTPQVINNSPYLSFMFVRDPLRRLLSAYRDKRGVRLNADGTKVSFNTFLSEIIRVDNYSRIDPHHVSYFNRCRPCDVIYDYYGTMETYDDDMAFILRRLQIDLESVPHTNGKSVTDTLIDELLRIIPLKLKHDIWERYKEDYYIFGYPTPFSQ